MTWNESRHVKSLEVLLSFQALAPVHTWTHTHICLHTDTLFGHIPPRCSLLLRQQEKRVQSHLKSASLWNVWLLVHHPSAPVCLSESVVNSAGFFYFLFFVPSSVCVCVFVCMCVCGGGANSWACCKFCAVAAAEVMVRMLKHGSLIKNLPRRTWSRGWRAEGGDRPWIWIMTSLSWWPL